MGVFALACAAVLLGTSALRLPEDGPLPGASGPSGPGPTPGGPLREAEVELPRDVGTEALGDVGVGTEALGDVGVGTEALGDVGAGGEAGSGVQDLEGSEEGDLGFHHVPPIEKFGPLWYSRYASETHLSEPLPPNIKLVLGVFTVAQDVEYRKVVRATWMRQNGVCFWTETPREDCQVYVAFVIGSRGFGEGASKHIGFTSEQVNKTHEEEGMFVLDIVENMDEGKSLVWFDTAQLMFPWATHIGKTDMDTYPFIHKLLHRMDSLSECVNSASNSSGYEFIGRPHNPGYSKKFANACPQPDCLQQFVGKQDEGMSVAPLGSSFKFLSGELYILSYALASSVTWNRRSFATEDAVVARGVDEAAESNHRCVVIRRLDAWLHDSMDVDPIYANEW